MQPYELMNEDEHTYHMKHPDGRELKIAKQAISDAFHEKIRSMAPQKMNEGGEVGSNIVEDVLQTPAMQQDFSTPRDVPFSEQLGQRFGEAAVDTAAGAGDAARMIGDAGSAVLSPVSGFMSGFGQGAGGQPPPKTNLIASNEGLPPSAMQPSVPVGGEVTGQPSGELLPPPGSKASTGINLPGIEGQMIAGIQAKSKAEQELAKSQEEAFKNYNEQIAEHNIRTKENLAKVEGEIDKWSQEYANGKIRPNQVWENTGTGGKISAAIGLILGGIGAGMSGGQNQALQIIQHAVDRDIDAQKANLGKAHNLLSMNMSRYHNLQTAEAATRAQMGATVQGQLQQMSAKAAGPLAAAAAQTAMATVKYQLLQPAMQLARWQAATQAAANPKTDPAVLVASMVPETHQKKVFDEIQMAQNTKHMAKNIMDAFEAAAKENTVVRTGGGMLRTPGSVYALHQHMQPTFQDLEGTVRQAAMDNTFKNITPMPGDNEHKVQQKREAVSEYLRSKMSAPVAKGFGIDLSRFSSTGSLQLPEYKTFDGIKHQKVPGGWERVKSGR